MDEKKKIVAALTGVAYYIKTEEENQAQVEPLPKTYPSPWAAHSRQMIMSNRNMMQRRVIRR